MADRILSIETQANASSFEDEMWSNEFGRKEEAKNPFHIFHASQDPNRRLGTIKLLSWEDHRNENDYRKPINAIREERKPKIDLKVFFLVE